MIGITLLPASTFAGDARAALSLHLDHTLSGATANATPNASPRAARDLPPGLRMAAALQTPTPPAGNGARAGEVYVDQVLESSPQAPIGAAEGTPEEAGPLGPGRTLRSVEYGLLADRENARTRTEQGVTLKWRRETLDYGFLSAEVTGRLQKDDRRFDGSDETGFMRFAQEDFAVGDRWLLNSTLGDQPARANSLITRSFRFSLPSSFVRGASAELGDGRQEWRVQAGRVGNLTGERILTFESEKATLAGIGYRSQFLPRWTGALQFWALRDDADTDEHASTAGVLEYRGDGDDRYQLHALQSSAGRLGVWLDADRQRAGWRHRYGAFRLDPGLQWLDDSIANDRQGLYWRSDRRATRYTLNLGTDVTETNIDADPLRAGTVTGSAFVRGTWLVRRDLQIGGSLDLRATRDGSGTAVADENRTAGRAFVSRNWGLGTTRLEAESAFTRGDVANHDAYELTLDHAWKMPAGTDLSTNLRSVRERGSNGRLDLVSLAALARVELGDGLSISTDTSATIADSGREDSRSLRLNVGLNWQLSRQWRLDITNDVLHTRTRGAGGRDHGTDLELFARLRWSETSGSEPAVLGLRGTTPGTGRISGTVFFDENRDGVRSPGELPVAGALVLLDGRRATARTDARGRYEFWPVFTGEHQVSLRVEDLPLPWGLEDETPRRATVTPRSTESVDFALVRIDQ